MKEIILKPLFHRGNECIGIYFENYPSLNTIIRKQANGKWSQSNKCWYVALSKENYNKLIFALKGKAEIEQSGLHQYLAEKKKQNVTSNRLIPAPAITIPPTTTVPAAAIKSLVKKAVPIHNVGRIQPVNSHVLPDMRQKLTPKAYSTSTIKTYLNEMTQLLQTIKNIPADELTPEHLRRYLVYCYEKLKLTENTLHSRINALTPLD